MFIAEGERKTCVSAPRARMTAQIMKKCDGRTNLTPWCVEIHALIVKPIVAGDQRAPAHNVWS